eukprot:TRINITY_DN7671_c0_g1_i1.p1 TRINITY_DN7671_c0_g1~~TRINITY_DN7671_c0_g1_i1.p1  ORF type:complete len:723 (-),score=182.93 TRINITY_DN7671_c0_g1_i1:70-2238(-)
MRKRKASASAGLRVSVGPSAEDTLEIMPLGAGNEVGRSCVLLKFKGKTVMFDCGVHPAFSGLLSLPFFDMIDDPSAIDLVLVSHFHLDHCAALPYFLEKTTFNGRVFMTHPTKAIYKMLLTDFVKLSTSPADEMLYTEVDLQHSMEKIERINYHEEVEHNGIKFWCYNAGHVLGAAMFMVEIAGIKVLYTGDFSRQEDRHLMGAETPHVSVHVLIVESTYGVQIHQPREERERQFTTYVYDIVRRGGRCLIPVFALGRAQELLLILDEFWEKHPELHNIPVYYASSLAKKCMTFYQTYINMMNEHIRSQFAISNPFVFKHVADLSSEDFDDSHPCVVMASPGMLQSGLSRKLFERWCADKCSGVILPGYCVEGTLAKHLLNGAPEVINSLSGQELRRRCSIHYISFSAHSDFQQTSEFIDELLPLYVVLVHGDANEMGRLKGALSNKYENRDLEVLMPRNCQPVQLQFRGDKSAKVVGKLAAEPPTQKRRLSGIIVRKDFTHRVMDSSELETYTQLRVNQVAQRLKLPCTHTLATLARCLLQIFDDVTGVKAEDGAEVLTGSDESKTSLTVYGGAVTIKWVSVGMLLLSWASNPQNDMVADAVVATVLNIEANPLVALKAVGPAKGAEAESYERIAAVLGKHFGTAEYDPGTICIAVTCDGACATVALPDTAVTCDDTVLKARVENVLAWIAGSVLRIKPPVVAVKKEVAAPTPSLITVKKE